MWIDLATKKLRQSSNVHSACLSKPQVFSKKGRKKERIVVLLWASPAGNMKSELTGSQGHIIWVQNFLRLVKNVFWEEKNTSIFCWVFFVKNTQASYLGLRRTKRLPKRKKTPRGQTWQLLKVTLFQHTSTIVRFCSLQMDQMGKRSFLHPSQIVLKMYILQNYNLIVHKRKTGNINYHH